MSQVATGLRRLNFGCGYDKRVGYLNVDSDPACAPDVLLSDNDLSSLAGEPFEEVLALDVLEHIPRTKTLDILLEWNDLLADRGRLILKTSSILGVARQLDGEPSFQQQYGWVLCLFGTQAHPGDFHLTGFTETTLRVHLLAAGFRVDRVWLTDRWLLHAEATKISSWSDVVDRHVDSTDDDFVDAACMAALGRAAAPEERASLTGALQSGAIDRRKAALQLYSSAEHLFRIAALEGFEPHTSASLIETVRTRTPAALRPPLRRLRTSTRSGLERARRAGGAWRRPRSSF
jgi:hypothetical protein